MDVAKRDNWANYLEFIFSSVGYMVGLGNIWRFPYVCYRNGGGAFLIPYFLFLFITGLPLTLLEISYCQYSNLGPAKVWECCPLFRGIGYGMVVFITVVSGYYNIIISWALYYFGNSFFPTLPWANCDNSWNTDACYTRFGNKFNSTRNITDYSVYDGNLSKFTRNFTLENRKTATEEFWERHVLELTDGIENLGTIRWQLLLCSFVTLAVTFLCLFKGIKTSGKVAYLAASMPYVFLTILLVRGATLPGALDGLRFYTIPRWEDLKRFSVWGDAAVQAIYSIGLGTANMHTLASYNNFNYNCYRDAMMLPWIDALTSWFAGCVIFVTLGYMAQKANMEIGDVVDQGPGIAFMVYPEALSTLPLPQLWSVFFFLMLLTVGLDTQIVHIQCVCSALTDNFPRLLRWKTSITAAACVLQFVLGIPLVTQGGVYVVQLLDYYVPSIAMILLIFLEVIALSWVYGARRLCKDIEIMIGKPIPSIWIIIWKIITPAIAMFVFVSSVTNFSPVKYGDKTYPNWAIAIGWIAAIISLVPIPANMIHEILISDGTLYQRIRQSVKPTSRWKPAIDQKYAQIQETMNNTSVFV